MTPSALLVFALALVANAGSPGPSVAALVARVLTNGLRDVLPFLAAMWLGEALWLTLAAGGLAGWAALTATMLAVLAAVDLGRSLLAARARRLLRTPGAARAANRAGASAMAGAAAAIAAR